MMKLLTIVGTRPEAVKMAPVLRALAARPDVTSLIADTGQHRDLLAGHLGFFGLEADFSFNLMEAAEPPRAQVRRIGAAIRDLIDLVRPDRVIVQGDTSSALAGAQAAASRAIPVTHVEAGLRTYAHLPWPEEEFRREIDGLSDQLLAPTPRAADNLTAERLAGGIFVTGNSGIDALRFALAQQTDNGAFERSTRSDVPLILATLHRRENIGAGAMELCAALRHIAAAGLARVIMPVHPNPAIRDPVYAALSDCLPVRLVSPLDYPAMVALMGEADLILTDSGGVQEEAPTLGKRVLVLREVTERPEGLALGLAALVKLDRDTIIAAVDAALTAPPLPAIDNPYGDGKAAARIIAALMGEPFTPFGAQGVPGLRVAG